MTLMFKGNQSLLTLPKTQFFCSRRFPAGVVLTCYDWAIAQREAGNCVIEGAHGKLERNVYGFLLKGRQSLIFALARGMRRTWSAEELTALEAGRLLVVSPFEASVKEASAAVRNKMMVEMADRVVVGYCTVVGIWSGFWWERNSK